jgi:hypothetical protein
MTIKEEADLLTYQGAAKQMGGIKQSILQTIQL